MEFIKSVWGVVSNPEVLVAALAVLGGLKVFARYTSWAWDDKALAVLEWPLKKLYDSVVGKKI